MEHRGFQNFQGIQSQSDPGLADFSSADSRFQATAIIPAATMGPPIQNEVGGASQRTNQTNSGAPAISPR